MIHVRLPHATLEGVFEDLDDDGALCLRLSNGELKKIHAGEVYF
jgi:biotin-(acetyl-CoA carboxylase) ligase